MIKYGLLSLLTFLSAPLLATTIQSNICVQVTPPVFTTQNSTTTAAFETISGTTNANLSVAIKNNAQQVATVTTDNSGDFSVQVTLDVGTNSFTATGSNSCGSATTSTPLVITRSAPPAVVPSESPSTSEPTATPSDTSNTEAETDSPTPTDSTTTPETVVVAPQTVNQPDAVPLQIILPSGTDSKTVGSGADAKTTVFTKQDAVYIKGVSAPLAKITISNNDVKVASLTAASDGSFGVSVPLRGGTNILAIEASFGGTTTTQILTYIRTQETNPVFIVSVIASVAILITAGIALAIRYRIQSTHNPKIRR